MIFWIDAGFLFVILIFFVTGSVASIASWIMNHFILLTILLAVKSMLIFGSSIFIKGNKLSYYIKAVSLVLLDMVRNGCFLLYLTNLAGNTLIGGIFDFIMGGTNLIFGILAGMCVTEGPMYFIYDDVESAVRSPFFSIILEIVSIGAIGIAYLVFT